MIRHTVICAMVILAMGMLGAFHSARAADDNLQQQLDQSYAKLLEHPADRSLNLNYAAIAMQMHDYEAAISPLERILMNEPGNSKIRLQVGILYHSLGADIIAKQYFLDVVNTPGTPAPVVEEARGYLRAI